MAIVEKNLPKLEGKMAPELKESRSATCLELEIEWETKIFVESETILLETVLLETFQTENSSDRRVDAGGGFKRRQRFRN